ADRGSCKRPPARVTGNMRDRRAGKPLREHLLGDVAVKQIWRTQNAGDHSDFRPNVGNCPKLRILADTGDQFLAFLDCARPLRDRIQYGDRGRISDAEFVAKVTLLAVLLPGRCMQRKKLKPATWNNRQPGDAELLQPRSNMPGDRLSQELAHRTDSPLPPRRLARAAVPHLLIGVEPAVTQGTAGFEPLLNILEPQVSKFDHA